MANVYRSARFADAFVTLEADSVLRRWWQAILAVFLADSSIGGSSKIVVRDTKSHVRWVNHGYHENQDPVGRFGEICDEVEYFGLDQFLRRHSAGYFSR